MLTQSAVRNSLALALALHTDENIDAVTGLHEVVGNRLDTGEEKSVFALLRIAQEMTNTYETDAALREGIEHLRTQLESEKTEDPAAYVQRLEEATKSIQSFTDHINNLKGKWAQEGV